MDSTQPQRPGELLERLRGLPVLVVGDLCLDEYRYGPVRAIAQEAPVACLDEAERVRVPGQAANVAANLAGLGARVSVVALLGTDEAGGRLRGLLEAVSVALDGVLESSRPTTEKLKLVATEPDGQHVYHCYRESREPLELAEEARLLRSLEDPLRECAAVVVSDYGNGVVGDVLLESIRSVKKPWVADTRNDLGGFHGAGCLKPNRREVELWWRDRGGGEVAFADKAESCRRELGLDWLCVSRGSRGLELYHAEGRERLPALCPPHLVVDFTGAGDTVSAALGLALAGGCRPEEAARLASLAAADVVARPGTSTPWPEDDA